jgi:hypothetical protein
VKSVFPNTVLRRSGRLGAKERVLIPGDLIARRLYAAEHTECILQDCPATAAVM